MFTDLILDNNILLFFIIVISMVMGMLLVTLVDDFIVANEEFNSIFEKYIEDKMFNIKFYYKTMLRIYFIVKAIFDFNKAKKYIDDKMKKRKDRYLMKRMLQKRSV